MLDEYKTALE